MDIQKRSFKLEISICIALLFVVLGAWGGWIAIIQRTAGERIAFWFLRDHLRSGEDPAYLLSIAEKGLPQEFGSLLSWGEFQAISAICLLIIAGLVWLALRLWNAQKIISP